MGDYYIVTYVAKFVLEAEDEDCANEIADESLIDLLARKDLDLEDVFEITTEVSKMHFLDDSACFCDDDEESDDDDSNQGE